MSGPGKDITLRIAAAALLAITTLTLFLAGDGPGDRTGMPPVADRASIAAQLDAGIDSVLSSFHIYTDAVKKRSIPLSSGGLSRIERHVRVGPSVVPVTLNAALNAMASVMNARAVATEHPGGRRVSIHIEFGGVIYHTVVLTVDPDLASPPFSM